MIVVYVMLLLWNRFVKVILTVILPLMKKSVKLEDHTFANLMIVLCTPKQPLTNASASIQTVGVSTGSVGTPQQAQTYRPVRTSAIGSSTTSLNATMYRFVRTRSAYTLLTPLLSN